MGTRQIVRTTIGGAPYVYDLAVEPLRDADKAIIGITCAMLEITQQRVVGRTETSTSESAAAK